MNLKLHRTYLGEEYTIGKLYIDGVYYCDTLEDKVLDTNKNGEFDEGSKIPSQTAIPYGTYEVIVNVSPKFKRELPRLLNVPYFEGILIHRGYTIATKENTSGCILVGKNTVKGGLTESRFYEADLVNKLRGSKHTITIV